MNIFGQSHWHMYKFNSEINEEKKANFSESKASQNAPNEVG